MRLQIRPEFDVLLLDGILGDGRQAEQGQEAGEDGQRRADPERILTCLGFVRGILHDDGEDVGADERSDLADGGGDAVVFAADGGGARLRGDEADVVTRTHLAKCEEEPVDDDKAGDVGRQGELGVAAGHDEADDALEEDAEGEETAGFECGHVGEEGAQDAAGHVEEVEEDVPAKGLPEGGLVTEQVGEDLAAVQAERVGGEVVDEPDQGHNQQPVPVVADAEQIGRFCIAHGFAGVGFWLAELDAQVQEGERRDDAQAETDAPCEAEVGLAGDEDDDHGHEGGDDEGEIDLHVGEEAEPPVSRAFLQFSRALGAAYAASWVFASYAYSEEESICGQGCEQAGLRASCAIGTCTQSCKDDDDDGRDEERPFAGVAVGGVAEDKHAQDGACEGDGGDVALGGGVGVGVWVDDAEHRIDGANDLGGIC